MLEIGTRLMTRKGTMPEYRQEQMIIRKVEIEEEGKLITLYKTNSWGFFFTESEINELFVPIQKELKK